MNFSSVLSPLILSLWLLLLLVVLVVLTLLLLVLLSPILFIIVSGHVLFGWTFWKQSFDIILVGRLLPLANMLILLVSHNDQM